MVYLICCHCVFKIFTKYTKRPLQCYTNRCVILIQRPGKKAESLWLYFHAELQQKQCFSLYERLEDAIITSIKNLGPLREEHNNITRQQLCLFYSICLSLFSSTLNSKSAGSVWNKGMLH